MGTPQIHPPVITPPLETIKRPHGIDVVLGAQWGDEGKGKLVDLLSQVCAYLNFTVSVRSRAVRCGADDRINFVWIVPFLLQSGHSHYCCQFT